MTDLHTSPTHLLHRAKQRANELLNQHLASTGLTPRQFATLHAISKNPGLSQAEITLRTGSDRSTITDLMNRLDKAGLIGRARSPRDARTRIITLTTKGSICLEDSMPAVDSADTQLLSVMGVDLRQTFVEALVALSVVPD